MGDLFINPIDAGLRLLEHQKTLLRGNLRLQGLAEKDINEILNDFEIYKGPIFSINRKYLQGNDFLQFCQDNEINTKIYDLFKNKFEKLYLHQENGIRSILKGKTTIVSTGTGSGKTEIFQIPILDYCIKNRKKGIKAIIIYPMNALANDQIDRLEKGLAEVNEKLEMPIRISKLIGSTEGSERKEIYANPPDILVTNYVMLDWMLTRQLDRQMLARSQPTLRYLVLDELHTYRGNKATHLRFLLVRLKSLISAPLVQIGTSATLYNPRNNSDNLAANDPLDKFIKILFNVENFELIEANFEPIPEKEMEPILRLPLCTMKEIEWPLYPVRSKAIRIIECLTGNLYSRKNDKEDCLKLYRDLAQHPFITSLRRALTDEGPKTFADALHLMKSFLPDDSPPEMAKALSISLLTAISYMNCICPYPLLDLRMHIFIRDLRGALKRCIKCQRFHFGSDEFCINCGYPLFYVYKENINFLLGKISGNKLKWDLKSFSNDKPNSYYVLIAMDNTELVGDSLPFDCRVSIENEEIDLEYNQHSDFRLLFEKQLQRLDNVSECKISLSSDSEDLPYLHNLVANLLKIQPDNQKKLLGFIDNKEQASRYAVVIQDAFASRFFEDYLKICYASSNELNVSELLFILHKNKHCLSNSSDIKHALFRELDLWFYRHICTPSNKGEESDFLSLRNPSYFTTQERDILEAFIIERAISKPNLDEQEQSKFIRLRKHIAVNHRGFHCSAGEASENRRYPSLSLAEDAKKYEKLVRDLGVDFIKENVNYLVERGVLIKKETPDSKIHIYINPAWVNYRPPEPLHKDCKEWGLILVRAHSSEIQSKDREIIEKDFKNNKINFLLATPTLELGIDIGQLQNVLMIGVPPMPSNYSQRAGRAGRRKGNFTLIITFFRDGDAHDNFYFNNPDLLINGEFVPKLPDAPSWNVVKKHINAFVLSDSVDNLDNLVKFKEFYLRNINGLIAETKKIFPVNEQIKSYLRGEFQEALSEEIISLNGKRLSPQVAFYQNGFFPDYSFRRDLVQVIDFSAPTHCNTSSIEFKDYILSEREHELACYKFAPDETVFMSGEEYRITSDGPFTLNDISDMIKFRSYPILRAEKQVLNATGNKQKQKYDIKQYIDLLPPFTKKTECLSIAYVPSCRLYFINHGRIKNNITEPFRDANGSFKFGYIIERQAILLNFDSTIINNKMLQYSLISAIDRAIKDCLGIEEGEIKILTNVHFLDGSVEGSESCCMAIYDFDGNSNVQLKIIYNKLNYLIKHIYNKMLNCTCNKGCYACLRSYTTRMFGSQVDKQAALMITGFLLGRNQISDMLHESVKNKGKSDLTLKLERHDNIVTVRGFMQEYQRELSNSGPNRIIFDLLTYAIQAEFLDTMDNLTIISKEDYIINAINKGILKKCRESFKRFEFNSLRFKSIIAEKPQVDKVEHFKVINLLELEEKAKSFVEILQKNGIEAQVKGVMNNMLVRIVLQPNGIMDIYNTKNRHISKPYSHNFDNLEFQQQIEGLWQEFINA